jgi:hypothetical protein
MDLEHSKYFNKKFDKLTAACEANEVLAPIRGTLELERLAEEDAPVKPVDPRLVKKVL